MLTRAIARSWRHSHDPTSGELRWFFILGNLYGSDLWVEWGQNLAFQFFGRCGFLLFIECWFMLATCKDIVFSDKRTENDWRISWKHPFSEEWFLFFYPPNTDFISVWYRTEDFHGIPSAWRNSVYRTPSSKRWYWARSKTGLFQLKSLLTKHANIQSNYKLILTCGN